MKLYIKQNGSIIKTYTLKTDFGNYTYFRVDKREELYNIDAQDTKYISAIYRPHFVFEFGDISDTIQDLYQYQDIGCDFVLETGAKQYDVVLDVGTRTLYHPAVNVTKYHIIFVSTRTYVSPDIDTSGYADSIYYCSSFSGTKTIYFNAYDIFKVKIKASESVSATLSDYASGSGSEIEFNVHNGINYLTITGTTDYLIITGV